MERFLQANPGFHLLLEKSDNLAIVVLPPSPQPADARLSGQPVFTHTSGRGWPHFFPSTALPGLEGIQVYCLSAAGLENPFCEHGPSKWSHSHCWMPPGTEGSLPVCCTAGQRALVGTNLGLFESMFNRSRYDLINFEAPANQASPCLFWPRHIRKRLFGMTSQTSRPLK